MSSEAPSQAKDAPTAAADGGAVQNSPKKGPDGRSDWYYAGWATLFSLVLGGPAFFLYELRTNLETRLWAREHVPSFIEAVRPYYDVFGDAAPEAPKLGDAVPVVGLLAGSTGDEDCYEDERGLAGPEALLEANLAPATGDREQGDEPVVVSVGLSNGVVVHVTGRASDSDSDVIKEAVRVGAGSQAQGVMVDWMLPRSELERPPSAVFLHPVSLAQPTPEQLEEMKEAVRRLEAEEAAMLALNEEELSPVDRARLPERLDAARAAVQSAREAMRSLEATLAAISRA